MSMDLQKTKKRRLRDSVELPAIWQQLSAGNMQAESTTNAADQHLAMLIFERFWTWTDMMG